MPRALIKSRPFVSVVVPVRDGASVISECIEALLAGDYPETRREIVVVDNGSTDATAAAIKRHPVRYAYEPRQGVSHARNRGIAESEGEIVAFLDADCIPVRAWLSELVRPFDDPAVGCVAGELEHTEPHTSAERAAARMLGRWQRFAISSNPPYVVTANAAFRRSVLAELGGFDPNLSRAQDVDLGLRFGEQSDLALAFAEKALARHRPKSSQLGFVRQQLGWAYGAGLVEAKRRALEGRRNDNPKLRPVGTSALGLGLVIAARARGKGRPEYLEDAWFGLLRSAASWSGGWAGIVRGSRIWRGRDQRR